MKITLNKGDFTQNGWEKLLSQLGSEKIDDLTEITLECSEPSTNNIRRSTLFSAKEVEKIAERIYGKRTPITFDPVFGGWWVSYEQVPRLYSDADLINAKKILGIKTA